MAAAAKLQAQSAVHQGKFPDWFRGSKAFINVRERENSIRTVKRAFNFDERVNRAAFEKQYGSRDLFREQHRQIVGRDLEETDVTTGAEFLHPTEKDSDGHPRPMTQEEIDAEDVELLSCNECTERGLECDDTDAECANCRLIKIMCIRPICDDEDARKHAAILAGGAVDALHALQFPRQVPSAVRDIVKSVAPAFRRVWKDGRSDDSDGAVDKANRQIERLALAEDYSIPGPTIFEQILAIHDTALMYCLDSVNSSIRKIAAHDVTVLALGLVTALDRCGLDWTLIVDEEISQSLNTLISDEYNNADNDMRQTVAALISRNQKATSEQVIACHQAEKPLKDFFIAMEEGSLAGAKRSVEQLQKVNAKIHDVNRKELAIAADDHELPLAMLQSLIKMKRSADSPEVQQTKSLMLVLLRSGGFEDLARHFQDSLKPVEVSKDEEVQKLLGAAQRGWKLPFSVALSLAPPEQGGALASRSTRSRETGKGRDQLTPARISPGQGRGNSGMTSPMDTLLSGQGADRQAGYLSPTTPIHNANPMSRSSHRPPENSLGARTDLRSDSIVSELASGPPQLDGVPGPSIDSASLKTRFGQIVAWRHSGRSGQRLIMNVGSDHCRIFETIMACDLGAGAGDDCVSALGPSESANIKARNWKHVERVSSVVQVPQASHSLRTPITFFHVRYKDDHIQNPHSSTLPIEEWITRTEAIKLLGKKGVDGPNGYLATLQRQRAVKLAWLDRCKKEYLHPDEGRPLTVQERCEWPWLFPDTAAAQMASVSRDDTGYAMEGVETGDGFAPPA